MRTTPIILILAWALLASPALAGPLDPVASLKAPGPETGESEPRASCAVTSHDASGSGVQPFLDPAAVGARVGTGAGSLTAAVYPYSCMFVILQLANPNQKIPREPLPEDMPMKNEIDAITDNFDGAFPP